GFWRMRSGPEPCVSFPAKSATPIRLNSDRNVAPSAPSLYCAINQERKMNPNGQIAIVTGGGSGLGEATARALAAKGVKVAILDVGMERAAKVAADIGGIAVKCDVSSAESGVAAIAEVTEKLGAARILVNCAGIAIGVK